MLNSNFDILLNIGKMNQLLTKFNQNCIQINNILNDKLFTETEINLKKETILYIVHLVIILIILITSTILLFRYN